jgi:DNA-binding MarR family transcriptional regulator
MTQAREELARSVTRRILHVASAMKHEAEMVFGRIGLTPAAARALSQLDPDRPLASRDLAEMLGCDRSNITALVDRLEQAGLVERRIDPADRRLKTLVVTDDGRRVRADVELALSDARLLAGLDDEQLRTLHELVWRISDAGCPEEVE